MRQWLIQEVEDNFYGPADGRILKDGVTRRGAGCSEVYLNHFGCGLEEMKRKVIGHLNWLQSLLSSINPSSSKSYYIATQTYVSFDGAKASKKKGDIVLQVVGGTAETAEEVAVCFPDQSVVLLASQGKFVLCAKELHSAMSTIILITLKDAFINALTAAVQKATANQGEYISPILRERLKFLFFGTGRTLKEVVNQLQAEGYALNSIRSAVVTVLEDATWDP